MTYKKDREGGCNPELKMYGVVKVVQTTNFVMKYSLF